MIDRIDVLFVPLCFDHGLSPGEGSETNRLAVARDGLNRLVLRGTSIAGVLRHAEARSVGNDIAKIWFGEASDERADSLSTDSLVQIDCAILESGKAAPFESTHHLRNRHTVAVTKHGLYSM